MSLIFFDSIVIIYDCQCQPVPYVVKYGVLTLPYARTHYGAAQE